MDRSDLLAVQESSPVPGVFDFSSFLRHHSSKASILWRSAFFTVQLSVPYMITGKTTALTIWTYVGRIMSLLFNTLSRFVIAFLPRSDCLLISWLQSPPTVIFEPKKRKSITTSTFSPSICHEVMGMDAMILLFFFFFLVFSFKSALSSFTLIKRLFPVIRVVSVAYLRWLFLPSILIQLVAHPARHFLGCAQCIG